MTTLRQKIEGLQRHEVVHVDGVGDRIQPSKDGQWLTRALILRTVAEHEQQDGKRRGDDGAWQDERSTEGRWLVSIHPEHRGKWLRSIKEWPVDAVIERGYISIHGLLFRIDEEIEGLLAGAKWQRRPVAKDPFIVPEGGA